MIRLFTFPLTLLLLTACGAEFSQMYHIEATQIETSCTPQDLGIGDDFEYDIEMNIYSSQTPFQEVRISQPDHSNDVSGRYETATGELEFSLVLSEAAVGVVQVSGFYPDSVSWSGTIDEVFGQGAPFVCTAGCCPKWDVVGYQVETE